MVAKLSGTVGFLKVVVQGVVVSLVVVVCFYVRSIFMVGIAKKLPCQTLMVTGA